MAANATATKARMYPTALWAVAAITIAPASTTPWIEFAADISGVCKVAGTLLMTSKPTQRLRTKMMKSVSSMKTVPPAQVALDAGVAGCLVSAGCTTLPFCVMTTPETSSSSRSTVRAPSLVMYSSSALMFRAYMAEAAGAIVDGRLSAPMIVTPLSVTIVSPGAEPSTLPPNGLAPMSITTEPGASDLTASAVTSSGGRLPGTWAVVITTSCL